MSRAPRPVERPRAAPRSAPCVVLLARSQHCPARCARCGEPRCWQRRRAKQRAGRRGAAHSAVPQAHAARPQTNLNSLGPSRLPSGSQRRGHTVQHTQRQGPNDGNKSEASKPLAAASLPERGQSPSDLAAHALQEGPTSARNLLLDRDRHEWAQLVGLVDLGLRLIEDERGRRQRTAGALRRRPEGLKSSAYRDVGADSPARCSPADARSACRRTPSGYDRQHHGRQPNVLDHRRLAALLVVDADLRTRVDADGATAATPATKAAELALLRAAAAAVIDHRLEHARLPALGEVAVPPATSASFGAAQRTHSQSRRPARGPAAALSCKSALPIQRQRTGQAGLPSPAPT